MRILIVEDERALCDTLAKSLKQKGYEVDACYDGDSALDWLLAEKYDLILLDLNLPGRDGMELLRALRERDRETRVLILSARSRISDKVEGLDCGANDYLVKPFHLEELEARVRSLTRRSFVQHDAVLRCGELSFDTVKRAAQACRSPRNRARKPETGGAFEGLFFLSNAHALQTDADGLGQHRTGLAPPRAVDQHRRAQRKSAQPHGAPECGR